MILPLTHVVNSKTTDGYFLLSLPHLITAIQVMLPTICKVLLRLGSRYNERKFYSFVYITFILSYVFLRFPSSKWESILKPPPIQRGNFVMRMWLEFCIHPTTITLFRNLPAKCLTWSSSHVSRDLDSKPGKKMAACYRTNRNYTWCSQIHLHVAIMRRLLI